MTYEDLKPYFTGDRHHFYYSKSVDNCKAFKPHADGTYPEKLIEERRPNEPLEVKEYRKQIWVPKTRPTFSRILNSLGKIRRSPDWSIAYPKNLEQFAKIRPGETLKDYCEFNFPYFESVTNWLFSVCLKPYLTDPNGLIFIWPLSLEVEPTDFLQPFPVIFECCDVKEYEAEDHAILNDPAGCYYMTKRGNKMVEERGAAYYVVDSVFIQRFEQVDNKGNFSLTVEYEHGLGYMPCFKLGGIICEAQGNNYLYESRISGILPEMDEAVREYSDLQAAKVLHVYPEKWQYTNNECTTCKGLGRRQNPAWSSGCDASIPAQVDCETCKGLGYIAAGPYSVQLVKPLGPMDGNKSVPTPPAGYVEKDVEIVKLMEDSVRQHIYDGLAAINFQELAEVPMNESGVAKAVDRDEQNNTVHAIAEDLVKIMDRTYGIIADYRYKGTYSFEEIDGMLPSIAVPEKFDLFSIANLQNDLKAAKDNKLNPVIQNAMEVDYAGKLFNADPTIRDLVALTIKLDPLPGISEDEKMSRLSNKGILPQSYIISSNINEFVQRAIDENDKFPTLPLKDQKEVMVGYALEILGKLDTARSIIEQQLNQPLDNGEENQPTNDDLDQIGKLPLAIQQLSLAATRAVESGDNALAARLNKKIDELLKAVGI
jgi:hypothetical protein